MLTQMLTGADWQSASHDGYIAELPFSTLPWARTCVNAWITLETVIVFPRCCARWLRAKHHAIPFSITNVLFTCMNSLRFPTERADLADQARIIPAGDGLMFDGRMTTEG